jgi:hypothetical protein
VLLRCPFPFPVVIKTPKWSLALEICVAASLGPVGGGGGSQRGLEAQ